MNKKLKIKLSIVIPCYNCQKFLSSCIENFEKQKDKNFEAIFINDNSTDQTFHKLEEKLKKVKFNYVLLSNKTNLGPGGSRNTGIDIANGKFITFVDADDQITENFTERINKIINSNKTIDCLIFDYYKVKNKKKIYGHTINRLQEGLVDKKEVLALSSGSTCCKVYRRTIIVENKVCFPDLLRSEDLVFNKIALTFTNTIFYLKESLYLYCIHSSSIMGNYKKFDIQNNKKAFDLIKNKISKEYPNETEILFIREYFYLITQIMILQNKTDYDIKKFINESKEKYPNWYNNKYIKYQPLYMKLSLTLLKYNLLFILKILFILKKVRGR